MPMQLGKHYFWICLWEYSKKKLAFESVDWGKDSTLTGASGHHSVCWGWKRTRTCKKGDFFFSFLLELGHPYSLVLGSECSWFSSVQTQIRTYTNSPLIHRLTDLNWIITQIFLALQPVELVSFHNKMSTYISSYIPIYLSVYLSVCLSSLYPIASVPLKRSNADNFLWKKTLANTETYIQWNNISRQTKMKAHILH